MNSKDFYIENFKVFEKKVNGESNSFLHQLRREALSQLSEIPFPTTKMEEWKYTDISPILKQNFVPVLNSKLPNISSEIINKYRCKDFDCYLMVFVNGIFQLQFSELDNIPENITITSLARAEKNKPELIKKYLSTNQKFENAFVLLNSVFSSDGFVINIPDGKFLDKPVQVLFINTSEEENVLSIPKNLIVAGKNSQVSVITNYVGYGSKNYFCNAVTALFIEEDAVVDLYKIQNEDEKSFHLEKVQAHQKRNSVYNHFNIGFGGAIVRNDINTVLDDENVETHYYGLTLANGKQHIDNHTFVDHAKPNCMSNELYKGILDDESRSVFNGKIIVRRDAQKTNAYQQNKTILLSKTAKVDTKPQLEIFADDVKCSHGATVGHLDDESEFYIRSRGVPKEIAKSMLIRAFANDVIEKVKIDPLKEQLNHMIFEHLHQIEIENN